MDDLICYKSYKHKYVFYSSDEKGSISLEPGEEKRIHIDLTHFVQFVKGLKLNERESFALKIKLNTSRGVLTTGWVRMEKENKSQYGFVFKNNPRSIVLRTDMSPVYSVYINPLLTAIIMLSFFGSFFLPYEIMATIVFVDLLTILLFGPFTFIKGFKNGKTSFFFSFGLGFLLSLMLVIPTKDTSFFSLGFLFFIVIYMDAMICSGGFTLDSE